MPEVTGIEKLFSIWAKKRFSRYREFGTSQFAFTHFGDEDIYLVFTEYSSSNFGVDQYANILLLSGIYRTDNVTGETKNYRQPFYITKNPCYPDQQAHRQKYGQAVMAWWNLTDEQKTVYNNKAKGKRYSGWNLFYKEYLKFY